MADRIIWRTTFALIFFAPLALGTVDTWPALIVACGSVVAFAALILSRPKTGRLTLTPMGAALAAITVYTGLQAVPLPRAFVAFVSPQAVALRDLPLLGASWLPLSLDPAATLGEATKLLGYTLLFIVAVNYFAPRADRRQRLLGAVAYSGVAVVFVGFVHKLFWDNALLQTPAPANSIFAASFVNPNHAAGFLGLSTTVALGVALLASRRAKRATLLLLAAWTGTALLLTLSRGGIIAFFAGQIFLASLLAAGRWRGVWRAAWVPLVLAAVLAAASWSAYAELEREASSLGDLDSISTMEKVRLWRDAVPMLSDFPVTGVGRGAFSQAFTRYKTSTARLTFTHLENEYLQSLLDWGIPGLLLVITALATGWLALRRGCEQADWACVAAALFALALHNVVDFNTQTGGVAVPAVLLLGLLSRRAYLGQGIPGPITARLSMSIPSLRPMVPLCMFLVFACLARADMYALDADTERFERQLPSDAGVVGTAFDMMARHPADYRLPLLLGGHFLRSGRRDIEAALYWTRRAMYLNPTDPQAHWLAARILHEQGAREEALAEYRQAAALGNQRAVLGEVIDRFEAIDSWQRATPPDVDCQLTLAQLLMQRGYLFEAWVMTEGLLESTFDDSRVAHRVADLASRHGDVERAQELAQEAVDIDPFQAWPYLVLANTTSAHAKDPARALQFLRAGIEANPRAPGLLRRAVRRALGARDFDSASDFAARLKRLGAFGEAHFLLGLVEERRARLPLALEQYRAAADSDPDNLGYRVALARTLEHIGIFSEAIAEYDSLGRRGYRPLWVEEKLRVLQTEAYDH